MGKYKLSKNKKFGFTLVETLLYASIISILVLSFSIFFSLVLQTRIKHQTIARVNQEGIQTIQLIGQIIRNAKTINLPLQGTNGATLSLDVLDSAKNPTVVNSSLNNIQIKEGTASAVALTSSKISLSNLSFYNISKNNTPGIVKFQFTLTHNNSSGRNEYNYAETFYGTASLR